MSLKRSFPVALALLASCGPAQAAAPCQERAVVLELLAEKYRERPVAMGLADNGKMIEVLATADGVSWTVIATTPQGISCFVASGQAWQALEALKGEPS